MARHEPTERVGVAEFSFEGLRSPEQRRVVQAGFDAAPILGGRHADETLPAPPGEASTEVRPASSRATDVTVDAHLDPPTGVPIFWRAAGRTRAVERLVHAR